MRSGTRKVVSDTRLCQIPAAIFFSSAHDGCKDGDEKVLNTVTYATRDIPFLGPACNIPMETTVPQGKQKLGP